MTVWIARLVHAGGIASALIRAAESKLHASSPISAAASSHKPKSRLDFREIDLSRLANDDEPIYPPCGML
jgi:hypothetical protein